MGKTTNVIYPNQIALLAFIASITFKVVMLPQYFAGSAGRAAQFRRMKGRAATIYATFRLAGNFSAEFLFPS